MPQMAEMMAEQVMQRVVEPLLERLYELELGDTEDKERIERRAAVKQEIEDCINDVVGRMWS